MTDEIRNILIGFAIAMFVIGWLTRDALAEKPPPPGYYDEQLLNYRYTEFCAVVGKPPKDVAEGINGGIAVDPKRWTPHAEWFNKIVEAYKRAGCGDA